MIIFVSDMCSLIMNVNRFWFTYALLGWLLLMVAAPARAQVASSEQLIYDGIDVSRYQGSIDWEKVASDKNIKFVYIKASEGATISPKHYHLNIVEIRKAGIPVGAYHFFHPGVPAELQFKNFTKQVKKEDQDLVPLIDVEKANKVAQKAVADSVKKFADMLEKHYGCRPMIYTGNLFYNDYLSHRFSDYPLFIARYSAAKPVLKDGAKWVLWQFTENGKVDGIKDKVDMNRFNKGCGLANILMKGKAPKSGKTKRSHRQAQQEQGNAASQKPVTKRKKTARPLTKEEEKLQKERLEAEKKEAERLEKQREKLRKLQEKEAKEAAKQEQKRREKAEKEAKKQAEKRAKEQKKQREDSIKKKEEERKKKQQKASKATSSEKAPSGKPSSSKASSATTKASSGKASSASAKTAGASAKKATSTGKPKTSAKKRTNQSSIDNE